MKNVFFALIMVLSSIGASAETYNYSKLSVLDFDQMKSLVMQRLRRARLETDSGEKVQFFTDVLQLVFSRPNSDNMIEKLLPAIREELNSEKSYYSELKSLAERCSTDLDDKSKPLSSRSTCVVVLNNLMSELRPELKVNERVKKIYLAIRDAKIEISDDVRVDRKLRSMKKSFSPSETAKEILKIELPDEFGKGRKGFWQRLFS